MPELPPLLTGKEYHMRSTPPLLVLRGGRDVPRAPEAEGRGGLRGGGGGRRARQRPRGGAQRQLVGQVQVVGEEPGHGGGRRPRPGVVVMVVVGVGVRVGGGRRPRVVGEAELVLQRREVTDGVYGRAQRGRAIQVRRQQPGHLGALPHREVEDLLLGITR